MIFKIQRPVATNEPIPMLLIYNKKRDIEVQLPVADNDIIMAVMDDEYKIYIEGHIGEDTLLHIDDVVDEQDW